MLLTTWEASQKYELSVSYLRRLSAQKKIRAREAYVSAKRKVWLIDEPSLKKFCKKDRKAGRPKSK